MVDVESLIEKYYGSNPELKKLLWWHSRQVADRCLKIAAEHPELQLDMEFLEEAALLHDIGVGSTHAPSIGCHGEAPYICHGYLGAEILRKEGLPRHARVCERHTGAGLSREDIAGQSIPVPEKDYLPETMEERLICYADKFYSKSHPERVKTTKQALKSIAKFGEEGAERFRCWMEIFSEKICN